MVFRSGILGRIKGGVNQGRSNYPEEQDLESGSVATTPLVSGWNPHVLAVLGDGSAGQLNALRLQERGQLVVRERAARIFVFDQLFYLALEHQQRRVRTLGAVRAL